MCIEAYILSSHHTLYKNLIPVLMVCKLMTCIFISTVILTVLLRHIVIVTDYVHYSGSYECCKVRVAGCFSLKRHCVHVLRGRSPGEAIVPTIIVEWIGNGVK